MVKKWTSMFSNVKRYKLVFIIALLPTTFMLSACSSAPETKSTDHRDPYESSNRKAFAFNMALDTHVVEPAAKIYQNTIKNVVTFNGTGLHSGKNTNVKLIPAAENEGINFKRIDFNKNNTIKADYKNVSSATLCTTLENRFGRKVSTVEHLLAALFICGIDNVTIEIDNEEIPILDGSAKEFINILKNADIKKQSARKKYLKVLNRIEYKDKDKKISIEPCSSFEVDFALHYNNKIIGNQRNKINFTKDNLEDLIESRTFCLYEDIEKIKNIGLAQGGSLDNAIVVKDEKILNVNGLRNKKEFVNHKILDLAGDFILAGYNILGKVECYKGGHEFSNLFIREILEKNKHNFEIIEFKEKETKKISQKGYFTGLAVNA